MTDIEAKKFINDFLKTATSEQIRNVICGCFSPRCSSDCPLKNKNSYECMNVVITEKSENKSEVVKEIPKKDEKSQKNLEKKLKTTLLF